MYKVMGVLEVTCDGHFTATVAIMYGPFAPVVSIGGPRSQIVTLCLERRVVVDVVGAVRFVAKLGSHARPDVRQAER